MRLPTDVIERMHQFVSQLDITPAKEEDIRGAFFRLIQYMNICHAQGFVRAGLMMRLFSGR